MTKTKWSKPGIKSTEFWLTAGTMIAGVLEAIPMPGWVYPIIVGLYAFSRGLSKIAGPEIEEK